jgi:hypothetical protein
MRSLQLAAPESITRTDGAVDGRPPGRGRIIDWHWMDRHPSIVVKSRTRLLLCAAQALFT